MGVFSGENIRRQTGTFGVAGSKPTPKRSEERGERKELERGIRVMLLSAYLAE